MNLPPPFGSALNLTENYCGNCIQYNVYIPVTREILYTKTATDVHRKNALKPYL